MTIDRALVTTLLVFFFELHPAAAATHVQLFSVDKTAKLCRNGELRAVARCSGAACGDRKAVTVPWTFHDGSSEADLSLAAEVSWEVTIIGSGCWAPPLVVANGNVGETRTAFVWPAATIAGDFAIQKGDTPPKELHATVQANDSITIGAAIPETPLDCSLVGVHWRCALPSTTVDLRLAVDGFVPRYIWGLEISAGGKKTLDVAFTRGASVSGLVVLADRRAA